MITKYLKFGEFTWDDQTKMFDVTIEGTDGVIKKVSLNKTYAFALMRFIIRISQRNWHRKLDKASKIKDNK